MSKATFAHRKQLRMESLPPEVVEKVCQYLTPRDLASCAAVSHVWREVFNEDRLWRPHCDPSLVETLEKTPSIVEPRFASPEVETSTLAPISRWRLAFLRQLHLWNNFRMGNHKSDFLGGDQFEKQFDFLSNTQIVRLFADRIEIWDIGTVPSTCIARRNLEGSYYCMVYRTNRLLVFHEKFLKIFQVYPSNEHVIELVQDISLDINSYCFWQMGHCFSRSTFVYVIDNGLSIDVVDLEKGMKIKTNLSCPVMNENQNARIVTVSSSSNSDCVIVMVSLCGDKVYHFNIYNVRKLDFSSVPIVVHIYDCTSSLAVTCDHLAVIDGRSLKIFNCLTSELVSERSDHIYNYPRVFINGFVSKVRSRDHVDCIRIFSLTSKTWSTVSHNSFRVGNSFEIINNKFIKCIDYNDHTVYVWEVSDQTLRQSDIPVIYGDRINESFTRGISDRPEGKRIYYYW